MFTNYQQITGRKYRAEGEGDDGLRAQIDELAKKLEEAETERARLKHKVDESNRHTAEAEKKARQAEAERRKELEDNGNYKELYSSLEKEKNIIEKEKADIELLAKTEKERAESLQEKIKQKEKYLVAKDIAATLEPFEAAFNDLSGKIASRLEFTDEGIKVLDKDGKITNNTQEDLINEFAGSADISYMLKGSRASGGGASGGTGGQASQDMSSTQKIAAGLTKRQR